MSANKIFSVLLLICFIGSNALSLNKLQSKSPSTCAGGFYVPKEGGAGNRNWDQKMKFAFSESFEFKMIGNDVYLGVFEENNTMPSVYVIISGWGNTQTKFYLVNPKNGSLNEICVANMKLDDPALVSNIRVEFNTETKNVSVAYNGKVYLTCNKSWLSKASKKSFVFSQYGGNVKICKDITVDEPVVKKGCTKKVVPK